MFHAHLSPMSAQTLPFRQISNSYSPAVFAAVSSPGPDCFVLGEGNETGRGLMKLAQAITLDRAAGIVSSGVAPVTMVWNMKLGGSLHMPSAGPDGTVYVEMSTDREGRQSVVCALKDGKNLWDCRFGNYSHSGFCTGSDGTVFIGNDDHRLYAVKDGKKLWEYDTGSPFISSLCPGPDETVYAGISRKICAVKDGKRLWEFEADGFVQAPSAGPDGLVYAAFTAMDGGSTTVYALRDGKKLWDYRLDGSSMSPAAGEDGRVYMAGGDHMLRAMKDGNRLWECDMGSPPKFSPRTGPDGTLFVACSDNRICAVKDGRRLWEWDAGSPINSPIAIGEDGTLYVSCEGSMVYALKDGRKSWEFKAGGEVYAPPCPGPDGMVYVADTGRKLYALREPLRDDISRILEPGGEAVPGGVEEGLVIEDGWLIAGDVKLPVNRR